MKKLVVLWLLVLSFILSGCFFPVRTTRVIGSGKVVTESRRVSGFSAVELSGIGTLIIVQGDKESLEVTAEDNIIGYLTSSITGKKLRLGVQELVSIDPSEEITYRLTVKNLERIETSGAGNVEIDKLVTNDLDLEISGAGNVVIDEFHANSFDLEVSGLGDIDIAGTVEDQRVELSGAGKYDAGDLKSKEARIEISGTGKAIVWVEEELDIELSGMGELQYYGSPTVTTNISGLGDIQSLGEK